MLRRQIEEDWEAMKQMKIVYVMSPETVSKNNWDGAFLA
jgi:hypothetical protein